jgi:aminoglycoside 6'-N-acetyltransferase
VTPLHGRLVRLRAATEEDLDVLSAIRSTPEVAARWGSNHHHDVRAALVDAEVEVLVIEREDGAVIGSIQWHEEDDDDYRHAGIDIYLHPAEHGKGFGTDAVCTLVAHLIDDEGHHRITIDPAADNAPAIRCYEKVGFKAVGVMRKYESIDGGPFHDGLLMDLLAEEFVRPPAD